MPNPIPPSKTLLLSCFDATVPTLSSGYKSPSPVEKSVPLLAISPVCATPPSNPAEPYLRRSFPPQRRIRCEALSIFYTCQHGTCKKKTRKEKYRKERLQKGVGEERSMTEIIEVVFQAMRLILSILC
uniref:Uncharacterized protein n=1 Tax=Cucumis sativus TaxID=3659 RepID=A0A0A0KSY6_CUCSA